MTQTYTISTKDMLAVEAYMDEHGVDPTVTRSILAGTTYSVSINGDVYSLTMRAGCKTLTIRADGSVTSYVERVLTPEERMRS